MTRHFCTYFDHRYLPRAMVLRDSLERHVSDFRLWALCMDEQAETALRQLAIEGVTIVSLATLEGFDSALVAAKADRSTVEYYFTCTPALPRALFELHPEIDEITYLDADLYFLSSPAGIFKEIGDAPLAIVPHRFPVDRPEDSQWGRFNVGWLTFRRDPVAFAALSWWRARCLEWCYDRVEDGKFADQGYLDQFPELFPDLHVVRHPGANLAPWNVRTHQIEAIDGRLHADGQPVVFFHVQGLRSISQRVYRLGLQPYGARVSAPLKKQIYRPYVSELAAATETVAGVLPNGVSDSLRHARQQWSAEVLWANAKSMLRGDLMIRSAMT